MELENGLKLRLKRRAHWSLSLLLSHSRIYKNDLGEVKKAYIYSLGWRSQSRGDKTGVGSDKTSQTRNLRLAGLSGPLERIPYVTPRVFKPC